MITRHGPPRLTPDIYSASAYAEICADLGVHNEVQKGYFKETIERAAIHIIEAKNRREVRLTEAQENAELQRLANSIKKSREIFENLCSRKQLTHFRIFPPYKLNQSERELAIFSLMKEVFGKYHKSPDGISAGLYALEVAISNAPANLYSFGKQNDTDIVLHWLWEFANDWEEISHVKFAKGNDYDSPCLRVLKKLILPINDRLSHTDKITHSMLDTAVVRHKKYKETYPDEFEDTEYLT